MDQEIHSRFIERTNVARQRPGEAWDSLPRCRCPPGSVIAGSGIPINADKPRSQRFPPFVKLPSREFDMAGRSVDSRSSTRSKMLSALEGCWR